MALLFAERREPMGASQAMLSIVQYVTHWRRYRVCSPDVHHQAEIAKTLALAIGSVLMSGRDKKPCACCAEVAKTLGSALSRASEEIPEAFKI